MINTMLALAFCCLGWPVAKAFQEGGVVGRVFITMVFATACTWTVLDITGKVWGIR